MNPLTIFHRDVRGSWWGHWLASASGSWGPGAAVALASVWLPLPGWLWIVVTWVVSVAWLRWYARREDGDRTRHREEERYDVPLWLGWVTPRVDRVLDIVGPLANAVYATGVAVWILALGPVARWVVGG